MSQVWHLGLASLLFSGYKDKATCFLSPMSGPFLTNYCFMLLIVLHLVTSLRSEYC